MNKELTQNLYEKYPDIFKEANLPPSETCMCWGFDHGDGWYNIIDNLCKCIKNHIDNLGYNGITLEVTAAQVKEKFGTLRFYLNGEDEYIRGLVAMAEVMSGFTCEICGAQGELQSNGGWLMTRCDKHKN